MEIAGKSGLGTTWPTEKMNRVMIIHTKSQTIKKTMEIGGTTKTCGVPPMNMAVHFMTATPILIFLKLQMAQQRKTAEIPKTT